MKIRLCLGVLLCMYSQSSAQPCSPTEEISMVADDGNVGDQYGWSVAIDGDTAVVGSLNANAQSTDSGAVYILGFDGQDWDQTHKLAGVGVGAYDGFGDDVAISNDYLVIGAPGDDDAGTNAGAAYVFERVGASWTQSAKLVPPALNPGDNFASKVDIDGDTIIIGAMLDDENGSNSGKAYIYRRIDGAWQIEAVVQSSDIEQWDRFGIDVAISGNRVLVGADSDDDMGSSSGSAYIFTRIGSTWTQTAKVTANDGASEDQFGERLDISNNSIIVGSRYDDDRGSRSGSAYIFEYANSSWYQHTKLVAFDGTSSEYFGQDVAIHNGRAIVGAWGQNDFLGFFNAGAAYTYSRTNEGWALDRKIIASDQEGGDYFGYCVGITDEHAIVGSDGNDDFWWGPDAGSAYLLSLNCQDICEADLTDDNQLNFFDVSAFLNAFAAGDAVADFTNDGQLNFFDVSAFLSAFAQGCP